MDWIVPGEVGIGNYLDGQNPVVLKDFRSLLSLDGSLTPERAAEFGLLEIVSYLLIDGAGNDSRMLRRAIKDLGRLVQEKAPVLVQCHAGRSRSPIVVAGHLMLARGVGPEEALALIASRREINVTPELVELLYKL